MSFPISSLITSQEGHVFPKKMGQHDFEKWTNTIVYCFFIDGEKRLFEHNIIDNKSDEDNLS